MSRLKSLKSVFCFSVHNLITVFFEVGFQNKFQNTNFRIYSYFYVVSHVFFAFVKYIFVWPM
jgi:hypothetical protein